MPRLRTPSAALPVVIAGAGALLALLAGGLALQSNHLLRGALRSECLARAGTIVRGAARDLQALGARAARGEQVPEAARVWRLPPEPGEGAAPPPRWSAEVEAYAGPAPLALTYVGASGRRRAATWFPAAAAGAGGVLVEWDLEEVRRAVLAPRLDDDGERYVAGLVEAGRSPEDLPFRPRAIAALAAPLESWRVAVGLRDAGALRRELRLQTALLGLLAAGLLALLGGSLYAYVGQERRRAREAAAREQLLARATHELQTPLALLRAAAETIARGAAGEPADLARCLAIVGREEERLTRAVRRLLRYLRLEAGAGERDALLGARAPVGEVVVQAAEEARAALEGSGLELAVEVDPLAAERGAPGELVRDTVAELLANARRHARGATRVEVRVELRGEECVVRVSDDGAGVPDPGALFEPWASAGGGGLGLALLREGWSLAGGRIAWVPSSGGAAFEVALRDGGEP